MKNRWLVFTVYLVLTFVFYHKALQVYFLSDDWKLFYLLYRDGFSALALNFESEFIRIIPCLLLSVLYFLFGIASAFPFHLLSVLIHALNAFLVFILAGKIFNHYFKRESNFLYSLAAGLIFISLPYQVEAVTWMSGTSDVVACCFVLSSLIFYFNYKSNALRKNLFISVLFFLLAVLSKESSFFLPLLVIVFEIFSREKKQATLTIAMYFFPVLIYILLNKFLTGYFITPGVSIFTNMPFFLFLKNYFLYTAKFFALYRLLPLEMRDVLKVILEYKMILILAWGIALFVMYTVRKKASLKSAGKLMVLMLIAFIISLVPVIHLETSFVGSPQSDRYGYLPSVFFVILFSEILSVINKKVITICTLCLMMVWFYTNVQMQNRNWVKAGSMVKKIVNEFKPADGAAFVTNIPDNYNGAYFLRNGLSDAISAISHHDFSGQIQAISFHTITSETDKAAVQKISESTYRVVFAKPEGKIPASEKIYVLVPDTTKYFYSELSDTSFTVSVKELPAKNTFYYYSAGSLHVVH